MRRGEHGSNLANLETTPEHKKTVQFLRAHAVLYATPAAHTLAPCCKCNFPMNPHWLVGWMVGRSVGRLLFPKKAGKLHFTCLT